METITQRRVAASDAKPLRKTAEARSSVWDVPKAPPNPRKPVQRTPAVDVDALVVLRAEPIPPVRRAATSQMQRIFDRLGPGDAVDLPANVVMPFVRWCHKNGHRMSRRPLPGGDVVRVWRLE